MKKLYLFNILYLIFSLNTVIAQQEHMCAGVEEGDPEYTPESGNMDCSKGSDFQTKYGLQTTYIPEFEDFEKTIHVNLVIWQDDNGGKNWQQNQAHIDRLEQIMFWVDDHFLKKNQTPSYDLSNGQSTTFKGIRVVVEGIHFFQNDAGNTPDMVGGSTYSSNRFQYYNNLLATEDPELATKYCIHIAGERIHPGGWGIAPGLGSPGVITSDNPSNNPYPCTPGPGIPCPVSENSGRDWSFAAHIAHEIGHNLGLGHTYDWTEVFTGALWFGAGSDFLEDVFEIQTSSFNCPNGHQTLPTNERVCYHEHGCDYNDPNNIDAYLQRFCTNNFMGASRSPNNGGEGYYMSPKQLGRAHRTLHLSNSMARYTSGFYAEQPWEITSNETWDFEIQMYQDILIKSGNTLTITCKLKMVKDARIIVEPGAKLVVDGGIITRANLYSGPYWKGIEVHGDVSKGQNQNDQGVVEIKNDALIEYAHEAIYLAERISDWGKAYSSFGGYVIASNSTFLNCRRVCSFYPYANLTSNGFEKNNASQFNKCEIIINDDYPFPSKPLGITMWGVNGVQIRGCKFLNEAASQSFRGDAIVSSSASYAVRPFCNDINCEEIIPTEIKGFRYGITSQKQNRADRSILVDRVIFEDNFYASYFFNHDNLVYISNEIEIPDIVEVDLSTFTAYYPYGLYVSNSTGFQVEANHIETGASGFLFQREPVGMIFRNTGLLANKVYRNTFDGLALSFEALERNRARGNNNPAGLQIRCNDFNNGKYDVYVPDAISGIQNSIAEHQGFISPVPSNPSQNKDLAGNLFSHVSTSSGIWDLDNQGLNLLYFHHDPNSNSRVVPRQNHSSGLFRSWANHNFIQSVSCPNELPSGSGPGLNSMRSDLNDFISLRTADINLLKDIIDGGDTPELIAQIFTTPSSHHYDLYLDLMGHSPYLSDEALIQIIHEPEFPDVLLRNILLANPHAAHDDMVWSEVLNRNPPLPQYMIDDILEGAESISSREYLEARINHYNLQIDQLAQRLIRGYGIADEEEEDPDALDSLLTLFDVLDHPEYYFQKASVLARQGMSGVNEALTAAATHNLIVGTELQDEYQALANVYEVIYAMEKYDGLSSAQETILTAIMEDPVEYKGASLLAHSVLMDAGAEVDSMLYDLVVYPAESSSMIHPDRIDDPKVKKGPDRISFYPNPANQYTTLTYEFAGKDGKVFYEMYDMTGRPVLKGSFDAKAQGAELIELPGLPNGMYVFRVRNADDKVLSEEKLIIQKR